MILPGYSLSSESHKFRQRVIKGRDGDDMVFRIDLCKK
jgi:hypothetical protein